MLCHIHWCLITDLSITDLLINRSFNNKSKNEHCGTSGHFNEKCLCSTCPFGYVKVQIIEQVYSEDPSNIEEVLW